MTRLTIAAGVVCVALATIAIGPTQTDSRAIGVVRSWDSALNAHDSDSVLALLADGATVQDDRRPQSREQIQGWLDELMRQHVHVALIDEPNLTYEHQPLDATTVTWRATLDMQMYRDKGVSSVPASLRARVIDGAIVYLSIRPDPNWNSVPDWQGLT